MRPPLRIAVAGVFVTLESALVHELSDAAEQCATMLLQAVGIDRQEAEAIALAPMPTDEGPDDTVT